MRNRNSPVVRILMLILDLSLSYLVVILLAMLVTAGFAWLQDAAMGGGERTNIIVFMMRVLGADLDVFSDKLVFYTMITSITTFSYLVTLMASLLSSCWGFLYLMGQCVLTALSFMRLVSFVRWIDTCPVRSIGIAAGVATCLMWWSVSLIK